MPLPAIIPSEFYTAVYASLKVWTDPDHARQAWPMGGAIGEGVLGAGDHFHSNGFSEANFWWW